MSAPFENSLLMGADEGTAAFIKPAKQAPYSAVVIECNDVTAAGFIEVLQTFNVNIADSRINWTNNASDINPPL